MTAANPKCRWYRLHLSTYVVLLSAAAALVLANVPGNRSLPPRWGWFSESECLHGWPLTYLRRTAPRLSLQIRDISIWRLTEQVTQFRPLALACDVLIAFSILAVIAALYEWRRRRREKLWRFSLRELMIVLTAFAVLFGLLYRQERQRRAEQQALASLEPSEPVGILPMPVWEQCGPDWVWEFVPAERFPMFQRLVELDPLPIAGGIPLPPRVRGQLPESWWSEEWEEVRLIPDMGSTPPSLKPLSHLTRLERLDLSMCANASEIVWLAWLRSLTHLSLTYTPVDDACMEHLAGLRRLEYLGLGITRITDAGLVHLKAMSRLEVLDLGSTRITDAGLLHLAELNGLKELGLSNTMTGGAGLSHLKGLAELEELRLRLTDVTDAGLANLQGLGNLRQLNLSDTLISDAGLVHLKDLRKLERLDLSGTRVRGPGLRHLTNLKRLEFLDLSDNDRGSYSPEPRPELTNEGLMRLKRLKNLKYLDLSGREVSDSAVAALREALPELEISLRW